MRPHRPRRPRRLPHPGMRPRALFLSYPRYWLGWARSLIAYTPSLALSGLAPSSRNTPSLALGGLVPQPDAPILGGLPLSHDDFRAHNAPLPPAHMVGSIDRKTRASTRTAHTVPTLENTRHPPTRRTRSQTALLAGLTPSRPDYRLAARSGFAASAASAPPSLRASPPSRSAA